MDDIKNNVTVSETILTTLPLFLCNDDGRLPSFAQISGNWCYLSIRTAILVCEAL